MSTLNNETRPKLYRAGGIEVDIAVGDPSITLIEIGDEFGFLLSESLDESNVDTRLALENVLWAKGRSPSGFLNRIFSSPELQHRPIDQVQLYRHRTGHFVAQDVDSGLYLPHPSIDPYVVVLITHEQYDELAREIRRERLDELLEGLKVVLDGVPEFTVDGDELLGPATYARGVSTELDNPLMGM